MAENNKGGCLTWIIILAILGLIGSGIEKCSSSSSGDGGMTRKEKKEHKIAWNAYDKIMHYCFDNSIKKDSGSQTGYIGGDARFKYGFSDQTISVTYTAMQYQATETGHLSGFSIEESCGLTNEEKYYPVSIQGRWQPYGSGGGNLVVALSRDNVLSVFIFGEGWTHWAEYTLKAGDKIISYFNDALQAKARLYKTEVKPIANSNPTVSQSSNPDEIRNVNIKVLLHEDGSADFTEVWNVKVASGTNEWYLPRGNLGDIKISNLIVTDETGREFITESDDWDIDRSRAKKAGRCGLHRTDEGFEICWGVGSKGPHVFTVSYNMSNCVKSLNDYDMLNMMLLNPGLSGDPQNVDVSISADCATLTLENTRIWSFGYEGTRFMGDDGSVHLNNSGRINYVTALLRFNKGIFNSVSVQDRDFQEVYDIAMGGLESKK